MPWRVDCWLLLGLFCPTLSHRSFSTCCGVRIPFSASRRMVCPSRLGDYAHNPSSLPVRANINPSQKHDHRESQDSLKSLGAPQTAAPMTVTDLRTVSPKKQGKQFVLARPHSPWGVQMDGTPSNNFHRIKIRELPSRAQELAWVRHLKLPEPADAELKG